MKKKSKKRIRMFPVNCTSTMCDRSSCKECPHFAELVEFKAWVKRYNASVEDPIWAPLFYIAQMEA